MTWHPIDFQGIIDLDYKIIGQLESYLQEKETRLSYQLLNIIPLPAETAAPILSAAGAQMKLSEAIEGFSKQVRLFIKEKLSEEAKDQGERAVQQVNAVLWEYTEVLEGCIVELFQQVRQVSIDRWHISIAYVVQIIKDSLIHRIEDLIWAIRRLGHPLREYYRKCQQKSVPWYQWQHPWKPYIDRGLFRNLGQSERFLKMHYENFNQLYDNYMLLSSKVEDDLEKMKRFPILALLEVSHQNLYVDVFRLLKILELNRSHNKEVTLEIERAIKLLANVDHVIKVFRIYFHEIKDAFFNCSLEWKSLNPQEENFKEVLEKLKGKVQEYQQELQQFMHVMDRYRTFMLKMSSRPSMSSRWGFTEWIVGPEPAEAKRMLYLIYLAAEFNTHFTRFLEALARDPAVQQQRESLAKQEIERLVHEMGQPLISYAMMRNRAQHLLKQLEACDEIGSPRMAMIDYVEETLNKAMREDWKYHVLHEFPLFHQIYRLYQGLAQYYDDPTHAFRLEHFHQLCDQIEEWITKENLHDHAHEVELDINDIKIYLQDFLAAVQRTVREKSQDPFLDETAHKFREQLLEYRYLFGQFFFVLMKKSAEGQQLRNRFLFVDQYFESVEILLNELKSSLEGKH